MKDIQAADRDRNGSLAKNGSIDDDRYNFDEQNIGGKTVILTISPPCGEATVM